MIGGAGAGEAGLGDAGPNTGGNGGVGGEGLSGPVDPAMQALLEAAPDAGADAGVGASWLYPYDQTVRPRGLLAPLLQWSTPQTFDAVLIHLSENAFVRRKAPSYDAESTGRVSRRVPRGARAQATPVAIRLDFST